MTHRLLTVCTGNICRSPVAEAALRQSYPKGHVTSAGLHALVGHDIDPDSAAAARAHDIVLRPHCARKFTGDLGREADMILVMDQGHRGEIMRRWPHLTGKTFLLGHFEQGKEIPDPYRQAPNVHMHMMALVLESVRHWVDQLEQLG